MITPGPGYQVDPNNPNGVIPIGPEAAVNNPNYAFSTFAPVKNEPAVISSVSGANNFQSKIQPIIDTANKILTISNQMKADRDAAAAAKPPADVVPPDVQAELDASKTPEQQAYDARIANYTKEEQDARNLYGGLTLAAKTSASAQINSLTSAWQQRRAILEKANQADVGNWTQQFLRSGQAEYSPGMTGDMLTHKEQEGMQKVKELDDEYTGKVNEINAALEQNNFKLAAQLTSDLSSIEQNALTLMHDNAKEAAAVNKTLREKNMASQRDTAIAGMIGQGQTDPAKILEALNKAGYSADAKSVDDSLKALTIAGLSPKDVSSDLATFQYVRDTYGLPDDIAKLPPEQQYFAYLQKIKQSNATASTGFTLGTNQIRFDENGNPIAYGRKGTSSTSSTKTTDSTAPTWEEYLAAAEKAAGTNYFMRPEEAELKTQYENTYGSPDSEPFSTTELKKLEQAGLSKAPRKEQLDYLFAKKETTSSSSDLPPALQ